MKARLSILSAILLLIVASNFSLVRASIINQPEKVIGKYNFNYGWKLFVGDIENAEKENFDDATWEAINLPYAWNQSEAFKNDIVDLSTGIAWYRKTFTLPFGYHNEKVFVEFEGVRQMGEVYINGHFIGRHENGVMAFGFDLTPYLKKYPLENIVAVKTDNSWDYKEQLTGVSYQWNNKNFNANYGGIPKNVFLHITPKVYQTLPLYSTLGTTGTYVYATDFDISNKSAVIHVASQVKNESKEPVTVQLGLQVLDIEGKEIASFKGATELLAPGGMRELNAQQLISPLEFWSWGYGYLYTVKSILLVDDIPSDEVKIKTGFRKTQFEHGKIYLNDRVLMVKGYAQRTSNEWPSVGMSVPAWLSDYSNSLMVKGNGNTVRWMHVTPWKQDVESCDRVGLIQAMPAGDAESDVHNYQWDQRKQLMRDAIIYNRNNPSILFYECGNESISEEHMQEMVVLRNQFDPYGGRAIGSREMLDSEIAEYGGEMLYINKSADIPFWAMEYSRDEGLRKYWDEDTPPYHTDGEGPLYKGEDASIYNRNMDTHAIEDVVRWFDYWEMRPGTGTRVSSGGVNIVFSDTNTHHRGEENYRRSGEVDAMRIPKQNYYAHRVIWDGWVDTEKEDIHIIGHWNYEAGVTKNITVVSTADRVKLFVNGKNIGEGKRSKHFLFGFENVSFQAGILEAVGYTSNGIEVCRTALKTVGKPSKLKLTTIEHPGGTWANANDLIVVQVEVVDKAGNRCPTALNKIHFKVNGAGKFVGGIAQGPGNYVGLTTLPVEGGVNRVFIRTTNSAGQIKIKASSDGLQSDALKMETHTVDTNKLSLLLPDSDLPSYLGKGPTPKSKSYKNTRLNIPIEKAYASSNQQNVVLSYDDNEFTRWTNENNEEGLITYVLQQEATISQIVMKLTGWRSQRYPIEVAVDGTIVYSAVTPTSLGYVTLNIPPTKGKKVTIALTGTITSSNEIDLVELSGKRDKAGVQENEKQYKRLPIIEIEFYETLPL